MMVTGIYNADRISPCAFGNAIKRMQHSLLKPRNAWVDKAAYDKAAEDLRKRFAENFEKFDAPPEVKAAGPRAQK